MFSKFQTLWTCSLRIPNKNVDKRGARQKRKVCKSRNESSEIHAFSMKELSSIKYFAINSYKSAYAFFIEGKVDQIIILFCNEDIRH